MEHANRQGLSNILKKNIVDKLFNVTIITY